MLNPLKIFSQNIAKDGSSTYMDAGFKRIYEVTKKLTMTSVERMYSMYKATEYVINAHIAGDVVECGVWKGGSSMIAALTMRKLHNFRKKIYLYDTYAGMTEPTKFDKSSDSDNLAYDYWKNNRSGGINKWCYSSLYEVKANLYKTEYPKNKLVFVEGDVEETIPKIMPKKISLLRLDTDWYKSTYHELNYLYPLLSPGGVLILDDYGHWRGARKAADKYFKKNKIKILLNRIDYTGRIAIKYDK
jgi:hypothetical protein